MKISLKLNKSINDNAQEYFIKAKKLRKKIPGAEKAIEITKEKIKKLEKEPTKKIETPKKIIKIQRKWFEKFRWFVTSNGFLVIAGKDANTNEEVIKKYTDKKDIVLHTDMAGSPFGIIKENSCNKDISQKDIEESADFILAYSKAWKSGFGNADIFYVKPEQVTKTANPGEFLPKGAFMIRGKTNYVQNKINFCVGIYDSENPEYNNRVFAGPIEAGKKHCKKQIKLVPGNKKTSDIAKTLKSELASELPIDDFIRVIPAGSEIKDKLN